MNSAWAASSDFKNARKSSANGISTIKGLPACLQPGQSLGWGLVQPEVRVRIGTMHAAHGDATTIDTGRVWLG
jgi:hypothetical protein